MAEEKMQFLPLSFDADESERDDLIGYSKSMPLKKHRSVTSCAAVITTALVAALVVILTALFVCRPLRLATTEPESILKFSYNPSPEIKEEVTSDSNANIVQFHVNSPTYELWVEDNFNMDIRVLKILAGSRFTCYVTPLNRTTALDPAEFSAALNPAIMKQNYTHSMHYRSAKTPIPDTSFLSRTSREMCEGLPIYWVYPSCDDSPEGHTRRQKRWKLSIAVKWWLCAFSISYES